MSSTTASRFADEAVRLGLGLHALAKSCRVTTFEIGHILKGEMPRVEVLQNFALEGADVNYILTGSRKHGPRGITLNWLDVEHCWSRLNVDIISLELHIKKHEADAEEVAATTEHLAYLRQIANRLGAALTAHSAAQGGAT
jgi:hypothetical protein